MEKRKEKMKRERKKGRKEGEREREWMYVKSLYCHCVAASAIVSKQLLDHGLIPTLVQLLSATFDIKKEVRYLLNYFGFLVRFLFLKPLC